MTNNKHKFSAGVILVRKDGAVLMQHRDEKEGIAYPGYWSMPGGGIKEDEDPEVAAKRELQEETGYLAKDLKHLITEDYLLPDETKITRNIYWAIYDGKQQINCYEGQEMKFIKPSHFRNLQIYPGHEKFFKVVVGKLNEEAN